MRMINRSGFVALVCSTLTVGSAYAGIARDCDGPSDALEQESLDRHRPILSWENGEQYWPISAEDPVRGRRLIRADRRIHTPASPPVTDIYVEIDWMETDGHSHRPSQCVIDKIIDTFAQEGYRMHIDVSNAVPHVDVLALTGSPNAPVSTSPEFIAIKSANFNHAGDSRYYYSLWCHLYSLQGVPTASSGIADLPGDDHIVSLGAFVNQIGTPANQVGTLMHELGHNLGQRHGGENNAHYKPNYLSVMNYYYQLDGIGQGLVDRGLAASSSGFNDFGYSHGDIDSLNEASLSEAIGIGLGQAVDWNCNGNAMDIGVVRLLHDESPNPNPSWCAARQGSITTIHDFDNWSSIPGFINTELAPDEPATPCITADEYRELRRVRDKGPEGSGRFCLGIRPIIAAIGNASIEAPNAYVGPTPGLTQGSPTITWSLVTGPSGMTINSANGVVFWSPSSAGGSPHTITIRATNPYGTDLETWVLTVTPPGDVNHDGVVDINDLLAVISGWGICPPPPFDCHADVAPPPAGDGLINIDDLLFVISNWGP
jgi:hypothetical protein